MEKKVGKCLNFTKQGDVNAGFIPMCTFMLLIQQLQVLKLFSQFIKLLYNLTN